MSFDSEKNSSSSTATTNTTYSKPISLQDVSGVAIVGNESSNISITDNGAVGEAFGFAEHVSQGAFDLASASQIETGKTVAHALDQVGQAYETAKAGEQRIFAGAALAVVGLVAAIALRRG